MVLILECAEVGALVAGDLSPAASRQVATDQSGDRVTALKTPKSLFIDIIDDAGGIISQKKNERGKSDDGCPTMYAVVFLS